MAPTLFASRNTLHLAGRRLPEASLLAPVPTYSSRLGAAGTSHEGANFPKGGSSEKCSSVFKDLIK
jgi:hypothetical protein